MLCKIAGLHHRRRPDTRPGDRCQRRVFSVIDSALLRPLPVKDASRLVVMPLVSKIGEYGGVSYPDYVDYKTQSAAFSDMLAYSWTFSALTINNHTSDVFGDYVSGDFFSTLGVQPFAGRLIEPRDEHEGAVVVLGYAFWSQHLAATRGFQAQAPATSIGRDR
jgi:hypothetical protein